MNRTAAFVTGRLGVGRSWASVGRIVGFAVLWTLLISAVVAPRAPSLADRDVDPDIPPSRDVRYVGPISKRDYGGFLPPPDDPNAFTLAWFGGSEVKLFNTSVPGTFTSRVGTVGDRPLVVDSYNVIAPRLIDVIRAVETADAAGADAIVIALNPAWVRSEWSVRDWPNLDVSNPTTLFRRRSTLAWAFGLTSPADLAWRATRGAIGLVDAQVRINGYAHDELDRLDILDDPAEPPIADVDPRLPTDPTGFWLVREYGPEILTVEDDRVRSIMTGTGSSQHEAEFFARLLLDTASATGVPVFMYATAASPESFRNPEFDAAAAEVEGFWRTLQAEIDSPLVQIEPRMLTRDIAIDGLFFDTVHMRDPVPFVAALTPLLCAQWIALDPTWECR
jgi:hypothetical protein